MIGSPLQRIDAVEKVSGQAPYASDQLTGRHLVALALRSPVMRGRIQEFDISAARALPGVRAVLTHEDAAALGWKSTPELDAMSGEALGRAALADEAARSPAYRPLATPEIFFAGQWIAVVVADTTEQARAALRAIRYSIEEFTPEEPGIILPRFFFAADMQHKHRCEVKTGPELVRLKAIYTTPVHLHQPMEPSATTAVWEDDRVTLYDSTQGAQATRDYVAKSLEIPVDHVRVLSPYVGGGFGAKNQIWPHQALAAHLARSLGRPVRLQLTRPDMAVASGYRSETSQEIELACDADGRLTLLRHVSTVPTSLRGGFFEPCGLNSLLLYKSRLVEVAHHVQRQAIATPTPLRGPGETPGSFALETALDELAHTLRIDPIELRIRNYAERDNYHGRAWSSNNLLECYRLGAERFGWADHRIEPRTITRSSLQVGFGMATTAYPASALAATVRLVLKRVDGLVIETSATDIGTGTRTILVQTVAEALNLDPECIKVKLGDSSLPDAPTAGRSRLAASILPAAMKACRILLLELDKIDPAPTAGSNATNPIVRLERSLLHELKVEGHTPGTPKESPASCYSFGAHFVEVEVDELIGRIRVRRIVSALDCGRIINPKLAESQIRGSIIFGIGMALMEDGARHPQNLRVISDNLADYAIPVHADVPQIEVHFVEKPDMAINQLGSRGLGEIGLPGVAAAIGNAVFNATGRRCRQLPIPLSVLTGTAV